MSAARQTPSKQPSPPKEDHRKHRRTHSSSGNDLKVRAAYQEWSSAAASEKHRPKGHCRVNSLGNSNMEEVLTREATFRALQA